ncbi:MAG: hypothetical protein B7Z02_15205 [Rhodobacterales bacterium 32-67-9]|nr:MAG: hypothetical protein B7Z02_15205 [Rhodobacterales bacterium 32-67-9]
MTRKLTASVAMGMLLLLILFDIGQTMSNPYAAPPLLAFGSGVAQTGGVLRRAAGLTAPSVVTGPRAADTPICAEIRIIPLESPPETEFSFARGCVSTLPFARAGQRHSARIR